MTDPIPDPAEGRWHLDKRVPVALLATLAIQTGVGIWWAAQLSSRVSRLEEDRASSVILDMPGRMIRLETRFDAFQRSLDKIDRKLDAFAPPRRRAGGTTEEQP